MQIQTKLANLKNHQRYLQLKNTIKNTLMSLGYSEVEVPSISPVIIAEEYNGIFKTELEFGDKKDSLFLTPHPELYLKRLIHGGLESCFSISRSYRNNEDNTPRHRIEFDMLEMYKVGVDYIELADDVLKLVRELTKQITGRDYIVYKSQKVLLDKWDKISVAEAFCRYAEISDIFDKDKFYRQAQKLGYKTDGFDYAEIWSQIYTDKVEPNLGMSGFPTLIYDYPEGVGATASFNKIKGVTERWEMYICGIELGNAANEKSSFSTKLLNQQTNKIIESRKNHKLQQITLDLEFNQIITEMPECAGIGIGVERLAMVIFNLNAIDDLQIINCS